LPGNAHDKEISGRLVERELRRNARIRAAQDRADRVLRLRARGAAR
jgi:hypothetical protein